MFGSKATCQSNIVAAASKQSGDLRCHLLGSATPLWRYQLPKTDQNSHGSSGRCQRLGSWLRVNFPNEMRICRVKGGLKSERT